MGSLGYYLKSFKNGPTMIVCLRIPTLASYI